ncbi:5495_t:CDS:2 [Paraglomus brasilianum]|uniref:5495_t:CDS:1 n=1 Tax=Paraglomus brasilianum TaxID=144538 RepID=A0A9N9BIJ7_9GLOM|nr:5495_t:CDS:2 [Paraglomus brasilianum]
MFEERSARINNVLVAFEKVRREEQSKSFRTHMRKVCKANEADEKQNGEFRRKREKFEEVIRVILRGGGYVPFECPDGGIDIVVIHNCITYAIQCKDHEHTLGVQYVRELKGTLSDCSPGTVGILVGNRFSLWARMWARLSRTRSPTKVQVKSRGKRLITDVHKVFGNDQHAKGQVTELSSHRHHKVEIILQKTRRLYTEFHYPQEKYKILIFPDYKTHSTYPDLTLIDEDAAQNMG